MTSWKTYKIGDIIDEIAMGPFGSNIKVDNFIDFGVPVLNGANLQGFKLKEESFNYVSSQKADSLGKANAYRGDIVITHRGTLGQIVYIPNDSKFDRYIISQSQFRVRLNSQYVLPEYFVYYFHTRLGQHKLLMNASQVGVPALARPTSTFKEITIALPPLEEQRRIAGILGAIDDKIENNRRINTNLESQAQALYKQWFVDNRSDDWEEIKLGDIIEISKKSITPSQFENTIFEHYSLPAYDDGKQPTFDRGQDIKSSKFVINNGLFLFSKLNPYIKRIWFPNIGTEHAICSTEFIPYKPKRVDMLGLCYSIVNSEHFYDYVLSLTNGSTGSHQRFHPVDTLEYPLCIPSEKYIEKFESLVMPMYKEIALNRKENRRLVTLRDTLLPKLMNGEIKL